MQGNISTGQYRKQGDMQNIALLLTNQKTSNFSQVCDIKYYYTNIK